MFELDSVFRALAEEQRRDKWQCQECRSFVSVHEENCLACGAPHPLRPHLYLAPQQPRFMFGAPPDQMLHDEEEDGFNFIQMLHEEDEEEEDGFMEEEDEPMQDIHEHDNDMGPHPVERTSPDANFPLFLLGTMSETSTVSMLRGNGGVLGAINDFARKDVSLLQIFAGQLTGKHRCRLCFSHYPDHMGRCPSCDTQAPRP